jgi:hypothetical protein
MMKGKSKFSTLEARRTGGDGQPTAANYPPARSDLAEEGGRRLSQRRNGGK